MTTYQKKCEPSKNYLGQEMSDKCLRPKSFFASPQKCTKNCSDLEKSLEENLIFLKLWVSFLKKHGVSKQCVV